MYKTQPEPILRTMPPRLVYDKKKRPVCYTLPNETPATDVVVDSARGIGDLIQGTGGRNLNEVSG